MNNYQPKHNQRDESTFLFTVFCVWSYVLLGRPQDIVTVLSVFRPALLIGVVTILLFLLTSSYYISEVSFDNKQFKLYMALCMIMALGVPFAYHRRLAFMFIVTYYIIAIIYFFIFFTIIQSTEKIKKIIFIGCIGVTIYSIYSLMKGEMVDQRLNVGEMFDPNDLAFFVISFIPFNFLFISKGNNLLKKIVSYANLGLGSIVVLMSGSRGGFVSIALVAFMLIFFKSKTIKFSYKVVFIVFSVAALLYSATIMDFDRYKTITDIESDYNVTDEFGRFAIWKRGIRLMITHPLTGVGVSCFSMAISQDRMAEGVLAKYQTAHNSWILIGTETGLIGFVLFGLISLNTYKIFKQVKNKGRSEELVKLGEMARVGFAGHFICSMFLSQAYSIYWTFFIALSAVMQRMLNEEMEAGLQASQEKTDRSGHPTARRLKKV